MKFKRTKAAYPYFLLLPSILVLFFVLAYPWSLSLYISFHSYRITVSDIMVPVGLKNYIEVINDELFRIATQNTFFLAAGEISLQLFFGLIIALALNTRIRFLTFFRTVILIPYMMAPALSAMVWRFILDPNMGLVNGILAGFGIRGPAWLGDPNLAIPTVILIEVWKFTPYVILILLAGLQTLPQEIIEASYIDGANSWQRFVHITFPWLRPFVAISLLFRTMFVLRTFELIYLLLGLGGPGNSAMVFGTYLVYLTTLLWDLGRSCSMALILVGITMLISSVYFLIYRRG